eukprot:21943_1
MSHLAAMSIETIPIERVSSASDICLELQDWFHKLFGLHEVYNSIPFQLCFLFSDNLWCFLLHKEEYELTQQSALESLFEDWLLSAVKKESVWNTELYPLLKDCIIRRDLDNDTNTLKRDFIESNYSPTLAYIFAIKNDLIRSKLYVHESYEMILEKWTGLPKFAMNAKKVLLSQLQSLVEISEFVRIIEMEKKHKHDSEDIVTFWKRRYPKVTDDVLIWDNLIHERNAYITAIQGTDYLQRMVSECQIDTMYAAVDAMVYQKNYCVVIRLDYIYFTPFAGQRYWNMSIHW